MRSLEWLNRNCLRSFPLAEDVSCEALNTRWRLPTNLLVDAFLTTPSGALFLSSVCVTERIVSITLGDPATGATMAIATAVLGINPPFSKVAVRPTVSGVSGYVAFGDILEPESFNLMQRGAHYFPRALTLETRSVMSVGEFPVTSLSVLAPAREIQGQVRLRSNSELLIGVSESEDNGDPVSLVTLSLREPEDFLSVCEEKTTPCDCEQTPIQTINTVEPDENGKITIELLDENGEVVPLGPNGLAFTVLRTGDAFCLRPLMPDSVGRLPANYRIDEDPETEYLP